MRSWGRVPLYIVFTATGASALCLQVLWQRVLTLHTGVDLSSVTTVVAAFMVGLGLGNLAGGSLADRLGLTGCVRAYAALNGGIALYALMSVWLLDDVYARLLPTNAGPLVGFALNALLLAVPTVLMGASLPLLAKGVVKHRSEIAPAVGRLYAVNNLGAAAGALLTGWVLLGSLGVHGTVRLAAAVNALAAIVVLLWSRGAAAREGSVERAAARESAPIDRRAGFWIALYGLTGAAALGFEIVFFRLIDTVLRSNSYSFGHVLGVYLLVFGAGAAVGARWVAKSPRPDRLFLACQLGVALSALGSLFLLTHPLPLFGIPRALQAYFLTDGFAAGVYRLTHARDVSKLIFAHLFAPLLVLGPAVFLMGAAFPCVQAVVSTDVERLGRQTGKLLFANLLGNFIGSTVTGFWLLDWLGTAGATVALALFLGMPTLAALVALFPGRRLRLAALGGAALLGLVWLAPSQDSLWAYLQGRRAGEALVVEDHACATVVAEQGGEQMLFINGATQSAWPFDDFHLLIGLTPALLHPAPQRGLSIGFGMGATPFGMTVDPRVGRVDNVELCGGEYRLAARMAERGAQEIAYLLQSPRVRLRVGDGRRALADADARWDLVTVDALRPTSQASGNLHSVEFYERVRERLAPGGVFAQWVPTDRTLQTLRAVFPWILGFDVPEYFNSRFMVASSAPLKWDAAEAVARLSSAPDGPGLPAAQRARLIAYFRKATPTVIQAGQVQAASEDRLNRDLFPRDEFFLNNPP